MASEYSLLENYLDISFLVDSSICLCSVFCTLRAGRMRSILCIDGGGVRGLVSSRVLQALEDKLHARGKRESLHRYFDIMVGTSAGGMIVSGLSAPLPGTKDPRFDASRLVDFFRSKSQEIFPRNLSQKLRTLLGPLDEEKYSSSSLEDILKEGLGDCTVKDCLTKIAITTYNIETRKPFFISNMKDDNGDELNFLLRDAVRATTAAPTYFEPARVTCLTNRLIYSLIDGGVFMNDPTLAGLYFASEEGLNIRKLLIVSIGSGYESRPYNYFEMRDWKQISWISPSRGTPILSIMFSGQSSATEMMLSRSLNRKSGNTKYIKIDGPLQPGNDDLDDASETNIRELDIFANNLIDNFNDELSYIADQLEAKPD